MSFHEKVVDFGLSTVAIAEKLLRRIIRDRLSILLMHFHSPGPNTARIDMHKRLDFLKNHRAILPLPEALSLLENGGRLPDGSVSIVIDDAIGNFYETGWPLLEDLKLPFTLAVIPGLISNNRREHLISKLMRIAGHEFFLTRQELLQRGFSFMERDGFSKEWEDRSFTGFFVAISDLPQSRLISLIDHLRIPDDSFMSWDQLRELKESGLVNFASHSMSHPVIMLADGPWLEWEIKRSADLIKENLCVEVDTFAYPYGHKDCLSEKAAKMLESQVYRYALTTIPGTVSRNFNRFYLPRFDAESRYTFPMKASPALASVFYHGSTIYS